MFRLSSQESRRVLHALAASVVAFLFYLVTMNPGVSPGLSALSIVRSGYLQPISSYASPFYYFLSSLITSISQDSRVYVPLLNGVSALFGAGIVGILHYLVGHIPHDRTSEETKRYALQKSDSITSAWIAVAVLMVSSPFWWASTRALPHTLGLFLLLLIFLLLLVYRKTGRKWIPVLLVFLLGLGCNELPTILLVSPLVLAALAYQAWIHRYLNARSFLLMSILFSFAISFSLINAWLFMHTEMFQWAGFNGYMEVLRVLWRDQIFGLSHSIPQIGWMLVGFTCVLPFLIVVVPKRASQFQAMGGTAGSYLLHLVILGISLLILLEGSISPWRLYHESPLMLTPYIMAAVSTGYTVVYFLIVGLSLWWKKANVHVPRLLLFVISTLLVVAVFFRNEEFWKRSRIRLMNQMAEQIAVAVPVGNYLISTSFLNPLILIEADRQDRDFMLINPAAAQAKTYLRYLTSRLPTMRYQSLAQAGVIPLMNEMINDELTGASRMTILDVPDLFRMQQLVAVPHPLIYTAANSEADIDLQALAMEHEQAYAGWGAILSSVSDVEKDPLFDILIRHLSRNQNNFGVLCLHLEKWALAQESFTRALELNPQNPSAMLNMLSLAKSHQPELLAQNQERLDTYLESNPTKYHLWELGRRHGYVADPEAYVQEGMTWVLSGRAGMGLSFLQQAEATLGDRPDLQIALGALYAAQGDEAQSREAYAKVLAGDPNQPQALLALARRSALDGELDTAEAYLQSLLSVEGFRLTVEIEQAGLLALRGDAQAAQKALLEITRLNSDVPRAWLMLAAVSQDLPNSAEITQSVFDHLLKKNVPDPATAEILARMLYQGGEYQKAVDLLSQVAARQSGNQKLLEFLLQVCVDGRLMEKARETTTLLLTQDSRNALANQILASLQIYDENYALAENSLRVSYESKADPVVAIDLGWLLQRRGEFEEALQWLDRAEALNPDLSALWHTRGLVQYRLKQWEEAEASLIEALRIQVNNPVAQLYLALVYQAQGRNALAADLRAKVEPLRTQLSNDMQEMLSSLGGD